MPAKAQRDNKPKAKKETWKNADTVAAAAHQGVEV